MRNLTNICICGNMVRMEPCASSKGSKNLNSSVWYALHQQNRQLWIPGFWCFAATSSCRIHATWLSRHNVKWNLDRMHIYLHTRSSKDCSSQCNLCSRGARELMMEYISWSMNCLCASTHPPKVAPEYSKNLDPLLNLRWWASSKLWPFWSTVQCWLSPWSLQGCRYWDYAGVPRCPRRGSGWSRFLQNHLWFTILLWKEIMLSLLRARGDSMDIPESSTWWTKWPEWLVHQLC